MTAFRIPKAKHHSRPYRFWFSCRKKIHKWEVVFDISCRYVPDLENDTNKLCGFSFFSGVHRDSARFGWTYSPSTDKVDLWSYCYVDGQRVIDLITSVPFNVKVQLTLSHTVQGYEFRTWNMADGGPFFKDIIAVHNRQWKWGLHPFFGGQAKAPHDMHLQLKKL